jgi:hypothetical protein
MLVTFLIHDKYGQVLVYPDGSVDSHPLVLKKVEMPTCSM